MACLIIWCHCTYFSEECTVSIFTAEEYAMPSSVVANCVAFEIYHNRDGWSSVLLRKVVVLMRACTASHPRRRFTYSSIHIVTVVPCISGKLCCFSFSKRERIGSYWGTGSDDPLIGRPEVNLYMFRRHSFAFQPEYRMFCLSVAIRIAGILPSVNWVLLCTIFVIRCCINHSRASLLGNSQVVSFNHYIKH